MRPRPYLLAALVALALAASVGAAPAADPAATTPTTAEIAQLEKARDKKPRDEERRIELGAAYYRAGRAAFDAGDAKTYEQRLAQAMDEWVEAVRLDPENPSPHVYMGIVAAYQGRIDDALDSFQNARALEPGAPHAYSNIAETLIYAGRDAREVESWLNRAERMGASAAIVELNLCLLRWRDGDVESAARRFRSAAKLDPQVVAVWNEAPVSKPIRTFTDLTDYCCGSPACGPYLERACQKASLEVARRELPEETALRELRVEMERRRALGQIYRQRKDLEVRVKDPEAETKTPGAQPAQGKENG